MEEDIKSNIKKLELYSDTHPFSLSLRIRNFENETDYKKFIRNCEKIVRGSLEYSLWRNYIIDILGMNSCEITQEKMDEVTIEIHHHIPSLFMLMSALVNKKLDREEDFCTFDIAQEAIELHFMNKIGYVAILRDLHKKFHNGFLSIPIEFVKGDYQYFIREFSKFLDEDDLDTINQRLSINKNNCSDFPYSWSKENYIWSEGRN